VLGITLRYLPSSRDEVVFEAVHVSSETIGQRRRKKDVAPAGENPLGKAEATALPDIAAELSDLIAG
jgi:hypothetical protein